MKHFKITILTFLPICFLIISSLQSARSARNIMEEVDKVSRESYDSTAVKMELSTCKYVVEGKRIHCSDKPRNTVLENIQKDYGANKRDSRSIAIVLEPISDKGIGMLTYEYDASNKDNDTWLYLSALGKVKRIISSSEDDDGSGSFFGSELSIEDMQTRKVKEYSYKLIKEEKYDNQPVWVIEVVPTAKKAKKTKYSKIVAWVDKEKFLVLKENLYNRQGKLFKQRTYHKIEKIDNVWTARIVMMNNLQSRRLTRLELSSVAFNIAIPDDFLTQRTLTDFAFRERNLNKIRKHLK